MFSRPVSRLSSQSALRTVTTKRAASTTTRRSAFQPLARPQAQCLHSRLPNANLQRRLKGTFGQNAKKLWRENPFSVTLAAAIIMLGAGSILYANYIYQTYIIGAFHNFPEPVAVKLRRALYYTNQSLEPQNALKYYKQALQVAQEEGMDPFSDEIIGVKIQVAALMEKINNLPKAIQVLEILKADCLRWYEERGDEEDSIKSGKRTRVLAKTVAISVKLGELYADPYVFQPEMAEERLVWAVETALRERERRINEGVREGEGDWMNDDEMGAALESLAHNYEGKDQHYLATPLFLQALNLKQKSDCHTVVLMNNLAISLAQQSAPAAAAAATTPAISAPANRQELVKNATSWAEKALDVAARIGPPERDEECDMGCAIATHNLGEFAEMNGNVAEARKRYQEAISLGKAIGFDEGVKNSQEGLKRLAKKKNV